MKGLIADIQRYSVHDGPGIRTTVFLKGCNLYCPWCHNPEAQSGQPEEMYFQDRCVGCGHCAEGCPIGARKMIGTYFDPEELVSLIKRDLSFYGNDGGVTFSGGEPLLQVKFVSEAASLCRGKGISVCIQTALCVPREALLSTIANTDIYLADVKVLGAWQEYTGGNPALLRDNLSVLRDAKKRVWLRIPAVPGVNDTPDELRRIAELLKEFSFAERVNTLPIFSHAARKYHAMKRVQEERWFAKEPDKIASEMAKKLTAMTDIQVLAIE